ncbi:unnamed protein product [Fraxinus pennsylvanica]|uniref:Plant heme peroxidase family profile domain-containing protein n=1 Tax=Fraxinus pennsylvanica TaxID=56036 RepID=A0AAD1ZRP2_9LAMI|nr:unnamed protein product [Fraxinus pennsylvanica]
MPFLTQTHALLSQRIDAPVAQAVWPFVHRFDYPLKYKHFIKSSNMVVGDGSIGSIREVTVVSGLSASASTERLEILGEEKLILNFRVVGGEHRLNNYRSVTSVNEFIDAENKICTIVWSLIYGDAPPLRTKERLHTASSSLSSDDKEIEKITEGGFAREVRDRRWGRGGVRVRSTAPIVSSFASNPSAFQQNFANAMIKMANIQVLVGKAGEIRKNCRVFNPKSRKGF